MMDEISSSSSVVPDRISSVPDDILVSILSRLSIKEAAMTSILSHRWEKLWICYQGDLEFNVSNALRRSNDDDRCNWPKMMRDHIISMNQVLRPLLLGSRSGSPLNSLTVRAPNIDEHWTLLAGLLVQFLMAQRIRILDFDINMTSMIDDQFSFPISFYAWIKQPRGLHAISALASISFTNVNISDDTVVYLLSNCPLLERLCMWKSDLLSNLRIIGDASLKLKHLKIHGSVVINSLVVSAPNLVSLDYECFHETRLDVSNVPKLVEVSIGDDSIAYMSGSLSIYLAQLHTLKLFFSEELEYKDFALSSNFAFSNLKHLVLRVMIMKETDSFLGFTSSLVKASPILEKFTLEPTTCVDITEVGLQKMTTTTTPSRKHCSHQRLKVVEFIPFEGVTPEVELFVYFVDNFSSLEQIIINSTSSTTTFTMETQLGQQLMKHIPPGVDLVLI